MKRSLWFVGLSLFFGLAAMAPNAFGQVVFGVSSNVNQVRLEGTAEAVGQVVVSATTNGTIIGAVASSGQSVIKLTFGAAVANPTGVSTAANVSCAGTVSCADITTTASGSVLSLAFTADDAVTIGDTITIKGVRINANAFGAGTLSAAASASVPAADTGTNPITFTGSTSAPVANVNKLATTVAYETEANTVTTLIPPGPTSIITCIGSASPPDNELVVNVAENFNDALTSDVDETGLAPTGVTNGSNVLFTFTNVPANVTIALDTVNAGANGYIPCQTYATTNTDYCAGGALTFTLDASTPNSCTGSSTVSTCTFLWDTATTNTLLQENADFYLTVTSGPLPTIVGTPTPVTLAVSLAPPPPTSTTAAPLIPYFTGNEASMTAVNLSNCVTDLLLPYVTNFTGSGTAADQFYDTGITIANTTLDPFGASLGASPEAGTCTLWLFPSTGSPGISYTTASVPAGGQIGITAGNVPGWAKLTGYVIGVCNFQDAHSFVSVYDNAGLGSPTFQQGYIGLIIGNPAVVGARATHTSAGESLGE